MSFSVQTFEFEISKKKKDQEIRYCQVLITTPKYGDKKKFQSYKKIREVYDHIIICFLSEHDN